MSGDTDQMVKSDGVSVGACRTDTTNPPSEFKNGVTAFEVLAWCLAGALTVAAVDCAPYFLLWVLK